MQHQNIKEIALKETPLFPNHKIPFGHVNVVFFSKVGNLFSFNCELLLQCEEKTLLYHAHGNHTYYI